MALHQLPEWDDGTVAILATAGPTPHAIPVSTAVRLGPLTVVLALARRRESLGRLRADPHVALSLVAAGIAVTAHGRATVVREHLAAADRVAAVRLDVDAVQDHAQPTFALDAGVAWRWVDDDARERDAAIRAELRALTP